MELPLLSIPLLAMRVYLSNSSEQISLPTNLKQLASSPLEGRDLGTIYHGWEHSKRKKVGNNEGLELDLLQERGILGKTCRGNAEVLLGKVGVVSKLQLSPTGSHSRIKTAVERSHIYAKTPL